MGFGSYDESDQREPELATGERDEEAVQLHEHDHEGTVSFESGASTGDLVERLGHILKDGKSE